MKSIEWLSGLLEGEGSFLTGTPSQPAMSHISLQMTDEDVVTAVAQLFGVNYVFCKRREIHHKDYFLVRIVGKKAIEWMRRLYPYMGCRRREQITRAIATYDTFRSRRFKLTDDDLVQIQTLLGGDMTHKQIATMFGVSRSHITHIANSRRGKSSRIANTGR